MERVTLKEYEAAKTAVLYGKEYKENSNMENNVIYKQYVCKDGSGVFYERTENGKTEFWSTEHSESRLYVDGGESKPESTEKDELSEDRQKAIKRLYKLVYWFVDEMLNEEDAEVKEAAEFEKQCKEEPDKLQYRVSAHSHNAEVMKDCMREARDAAEFLKNKENDIEEWQVAGINAMFDRCNAEKIIPYDLPTAVKGLLCMHILCKPICIEAETK
ncbi:MAG: hypothetical protein Q4C63_08145 [Eubacteriales bacterium]|nr:hypothetical protein [Eubacteriales bacterium]